eukprot:5334619-Amphidinium_carterae.1
MFDVNGLPLPQRFGKNKLLATWRVLAIILESRCAHRQPEAMSALHLSHVTPTMSSNQNHHHQHEGPVFELSY